MSRRNGHRKKGIGKRQNNRKERFADKNQGPSLFVPTRLEKFFSLRDSPTPTGRLLGSQPEMQWLRAYKTDVMTPEMAERQIEAYRQAYPGLREIVAADFGEIEKRLLTHYMGADLDGQTSTVFDPSTDNILTLDKLQALKAQIGPPPPYDTLCFSPWIKRARLRAGMMWCPWSWQKRSELIDEINKTPVPFRIKIRIMGPMGSRHRRKNRAYFTGYGGIVKPGFVP